jgi:hypothetical protein
MANAQNDDLTLSVIMICVEVSFWVQLCKYLDRFCGLVVPGSIPGAASFSE